MNKLELVPEIVIANKIYLIRGKKVMLSFDLAELYEVETKRLNEQVKRNIGKFPDRFMFQITQDEYVFLRSQFATFKMKVPAKYPPYAFTEHGILMLSSVLKSEKADKVNILIIDTFVKMNEMLLSHKDILLKLEEMEKKVAGQDEKVKMIFNYLKQFIHQQETPRKQIGYKITDV
jgi:hypothetical protein